MELNGVVHPTAHKPRGGDPGVVQRVRAEFLEMPGLRLTPAQARRLWNLEGEMCREVIEALVAEAFLRWTASGAVTRLEA